MSGLPHTITLHDKNGIWAIYKDEYEDEYTRLLETTTKDEVKQQVYENYKISQKNGTVIFEENTPANSASSQPLLPTYYSVYDKNKAIAFADTYAPSSASPAPIPQAIKDAYQTTYGTSYPSSWPPNYKVESGTDCTNFISQAIFEGTWYTDGETNHFYPTNPSDYNWYYKFAPNYPPPAQGSATWTQVGLLYDFLLNSSTLKRGPYGIAVGSTSFCTNIKPFDPIFMMSGSTWQHAVIVSSKSSPCYSPNNILVDSHTSYYKQTPLPTFSGLSWYGVNIMGYIETPYIFADVPPNYWDWQDIEHLYNSGITAGCSTNPLNYCPESDVTRAQMAVFLLRGIYDPSYIPPAVEGTRFLDVLDSYWAADWVEQLAAEGITVGCGYGNYCPDSGVKHSEMAVFLLRSKHGSSYLPPEVNGTRFADVPDSYWAADWIEQLAAEGISFGAHGRTSGYCPEYPVTRAEMAGLFVRTFNLP